MNASVLSRLEGSRSADRSDRERLCRASLPTVVMDLDGLRPVDTPGAVVTLERRELERRRRAYDESRISRGR